jgi:pimeloyl-ACP methyl ester carboxylesterase
MSDTRSPIPDTTYTATWTRRQDHVAFFTLANGSRVRYLKAGAGPPLVLLHTVRTQLDYFQLVIPQLLNSFTVYALDLPGMGWSDIVRGASYEEPDLRAAVVEFVTGLGLDGVTLAGESMGATLALSASPDLAGKVSRVVAFNPYDYPEGIQRGNRLANLIVAGARLPVVGRVFTRMENTTVLRGIMRGGLADEGNLPEGFLTELRRVGRRKGYPRVAHAIFRNLNGLIAARERYPLIQVPVILVYGDLDWSRPTDRESVHRLLPTAETKTLPHTGHFTALERPAEWVRILLNTRALQQRSDPDLGQEPTALRRYA